MVLHARMGNDPALGPYDSSRVYIGHPLETARTASVPNPEMPVPLGNMEPIGLVGSGSKPSQA